MTSLQTSRRKATVVSDLPFLLLMIAVPAIGAAVVAALPQGRDELAKQITLALSLVVLLLAVLATVAFDVDGERFQLTSSFDVDPRLRGVASPSASTASRW